MRNEKCTAIVLAAGKGTRMSTSIEKQFMNVNGKPLLYYSMNVFQESDIIDEIILVVGKGQEEYCKSKIVEAYNMTKVIAIIEGGKERYHSVYNGLQQIQDGYVFIHDGARPFVNEEMIENSYQMVKETQACVIGMPIKDTVKIINENGFAIHTPDREFVWIVQTPQVFEARLIKKAYEKLLTNELVQVTDDAMVVEQMLNHPVKLLKGSYKNIKITTFEDLEIAETFLNKKGQIAIDKEHG